MGYQSSKINTKYQLYKKKYKDKYRLIVEESNSLITGYVAGFSDTTKRYAIQENKKPTMSPSNYKKMWHRIKIVPKQKQKGFLSIIGLGYKEYTEEEYAIKYFIDYVDSQEQRKACNEPFIV